jgi:hypothetical protein
VLCGSSCFEIHCWMHFLPVSAFPGNLAWIAPHMKGGDKASPARCRSPYCAQSAGLGPIYTCTSALPHHICSQALQAVTIPHADLAARVSLMEESLQVHPVGGAESYQRSRDVATHNQASSNAQHASVGSAEEWGDEGDIALSALKDVKNSMFVHQKMFDFGGTPLDGVEAAGILDHGLLAALSLDYTATGTKGSHWQGCLHALTRCACCYQPVHLQSVHT